MKTIKVMAAVAAIALPLQFAQAEDATVNAQIVLPSVTGASGGMGIALGYEMPMPDVNPNFSFEGEFTTSISSPSDSESASYSDPFLGTVTAKAENELSYYTLAAYAKYTHPVNPKLDLYGRVGLLYESVTVDYTSSVTYSGFPALNQSGSDSASETDTGLSYGFGMNYSLNEKMDFTAGYTIIEKDIKHLSAGLKFKL